MPFTLAHPAVVLPLMRRPFVGLALVCGALAPDIPYYIRATRLPVSAQSWYEPFTNATTSHSLAGLLPVTLPLGLVLHLLLLAAAAPLVWLAWGRWDGEAPPLAQAGPKEAAGARRRLARWAWVPVSLLVGAVTHLWWDSLASSDGFLAGRFDAMNATAVGGWTWVDLLQHGSSVVGILVLAVFLWRWSRRIIGHGTPPLRRVYWVPVGLMAVGLVVGAIAVVTTMDPATPGGALSIEGALATTLIGGGAAVGVLALLGIGTWWVVRSTRP